MSISSRAALLAAATMILAQTTSLAATPPTTFNQAPYLHAQRLIDIGGRRLNLYCTGHGSPTVVLEAGGGDDMLDWRVVQPRVAKFTRVCSYDRAGYGFSDPGPAPRDASASVTDLHALVARAGIARPFVLVGYSEGESYARVYADRYLHDLAGMVLVEPAFEGQEEARADAAVPILAQNAAQMAITDRACAAAAERDGLKPHTRTYEACAPLPVPEYPAALNAIVLQQSLRPGFWKDYESENDEASRTTTPAEVRSEQRSYGSLPLALLTVKNELPDGALPPDQQRTLRKIMRDGRGSITSYSSRSSHVELRGCNHGDVVSRCAAGVVSAVDHVVDRARAIP